jgi:hypothetical protein
MYEELFNQPLKTLMWSYDKYFRAMLKELITDGYDKNQMCALERGFMPLNQAEILRRMPETYSGTESYDNGEDTLLIGFNWLMVPDLQFQMQRGPYLQNKLVDESLVQGVGIEGAGDDRRRRRHYSGAFGAVSA